MFGLVIEGTKILKQTIVLNKLKVSSTVEKNKEFPDKKLKYAEFTISSVRLKKH